MIDTEAATGHAVAVRLFTAFATALDTKDWQSYQALYAPEATLTLPWGDPVPQSELAQDTEANLGQFTQTQHVITNHQVNGSGGRLNASAYLIATHVYPPEYVRAHWVVGARYDAQIGDVGGRHRFLGVSVTLLWQTGAPGLQ